MKAGDAIYSYNLETNEVVKDVIKSNFPASIKTHYYKATLDDNTEINATEFHRFYDWATKDWIKFGDYKVGDKIYTAEKQEKTVINIEQINEETPCYDLDVLNNDNYFIVTGQTNKYLVHNANGDNCGDAN